MSHKQKKERDERATIEARDKYGALRFRRPLNIAVLRLEGILAPTTKGAPPQMNAVPEERVLERVSDYWNLRTEIEQRRIVVPDLVGQLFFALCEMCGMLMMPEEKRP